MIFQITPSKTFPSIHSQTSPNPIPDQSQFRQSLPLKTKIQFYQNFLPAKRSANHSMFFRRLVKANFDISILLFRFFISLAVFTTNPNPEITPRTTGFIVTPPAIVPIATKPEEVKFMSRFIFLNRPCARFRHQNLL